MGGSETLFGILSLAFGLGLVHALDADHVIAVSTLAGRADGSTRTPVWYCLRWALGHGGSLLLFGMLAFATGMAIPQTLGSLAEMAVGVVMVIMGGMLIYRIRRHRLHLGFHRHPGLPNHAHWQTDGGSPAKPGHHHGATLVGALHGVAGSAPLLALIPVVASGSFWPALLYLLLFSGGVWFSMLLCGGALGALFGRLSSYGERALNGVRCSIGGGSILAGGYLIQGVF